MNNLPNIKLMLNFYFILQQEILGRTNHLFSSDLTPYHIQNNVPNGFCVVTYVRCHSNISTGLLLSNDRWITKMHRLMDGFMEYTVEMDSDNMTYIPSFIKIGSGIKKSDCGERFTDTPLGLHTSTSVFS
jgi:hypothetical protein